MHALKEHGHKDSDFSVVGRDEAAEETSGASWVDEMKAKFSKEPPLRETLKRVGHSDDEVAKHYEEVERGGIALFVKERDDHDHNHDHDHDEGHRHEGKVENPGVNDYEAEQDANHEKSTRTKWDADDLNK